MSRKLTTRNHNHPHYRYKDFQQSMREAYRRLSAEQLDKVCAIESIPLNSPRHVKLDAILVIACKKWKEDWKFTHGWDFDDIYDEAKFQTHIKDAMAEREKLKASAIDHRPKLPDGTLLTKEIFDKLDSATQAAVRADLKVRIDAIIASGYAGVLQNGNIVDRRQFNDATPIQKNEKLGTPEPLPLR